MSTKRCRAVVVGFALLAVGAFGASAAVAEPGPFWHHRPVGGEGVGEKVSSASPENFSGEGGEQILKGKIGTTEVEMATESAQIKGIFFNNVRRGQFKIRRIFNRPWRFIRPVLPSCQVKVNFQFSISGQLAWKYGGKSTELTEKPVTLQKPTEVETPAEIAEGETKLPEGTIAEITLSPAKECGVLTGAFPLKGSISGLLKPANLEEWTTKVAFASPGWKQLHFWNGKEQIAVEPSLVFASNPATYSGTSEVKTAAQEVAIFEK